jgi:hypothetical protein
LELLHSTRTEYQALLDEVASNPKWAELLDLFDAIRCDEEGIPTADLWRRQDEHTARLYQGQRITDVRAAE